MSKKELNYATLIYCGKDFDHYTYYGNGVHKYHFVDDCYVHYEFFDKGGYHTDAFFSALRYGTKVKIGWTRYGNTWKKILHTWEIADTQGGENEE